MSDIFLSYARTDLSRVRPLVDTLSKRGWSVWWDRTIQPGQILAREIQVAVDDACCVIVFVLWFTQRRRLAQSQELGLHLQNSRRTLRSRIGLTG